MRIPLKNETWAAVPTCLGSHAASKIVERVQETQSLPTADVAVVVKEQGIQKLVDNLASPKTDMRDSAAIALSHLVSSVTPEFHEALLTFDAKLAWKTLLKDSKEGMRITISGILESVYSENDAHKTSIMSFEGNVIVRIMVEILPQFEDLSNLSYHLNHLRNFYCTNDVPDSHLVETMRSLRIIDKLMEVRLKLGTQDGPAKVMCDEIVDTMIGELAIRGFRGTV